LNDAMSRTIRTTAGRRRWLAGLAAVGATPFLAACDKLGIGEAKTVFKNVDITGASYASHLAMTDQDGQPRSLADFKGKVVVVFFGYTQCPDVCPTTMNDLAQIRKSLGADADKLQGLFVTIDPERDTGPVLKAYMSGFDPSFVALRGTTDEVTAAAKEFKVFFAKVPGKTADGYTMDHTAASFVFDPKGNVRLFARYGIGTEALAADVKQLLAGA
jgi:protein SCO1/2